MILMMVDWRTSNYKLYGLESLLTDRISHDEDSYAFTIGRCNSFGHSFISSRA